MPVTVRITGPDLSQLKLTAADVMREVGLLARERILRRTVSGIDLHDQPFAPYSAAYADRKGREVGAGPVNLQLSGGMLNGLVIIDVTPTSVSLGFSS